MPNREIELLEGYKVKVNEQLFDDIDFISDFNEAARENNLKDIIVMAMAVVGGEDTYKEIRKRIETEHGYFSQKAFEPVLNKIVELFPKGGNRAQRRSWSTSSK